MCIISNPVNSTVPIVREVFKKAGVCDSDANAFGAIAESVLGERVLLYLVMSYGSSL